MELAVAVFESAIEYQSGRTGLKDLALNSIKGFLAAGLFSTVPVELFSLAVKETLNTFSAQGGLLCLFTVILMGYAVIKVFFASLKRGGILLIQIAIGSLYLFSVPRGYIVKVLQPERHIIGKSGTIAIEQDNSNARHCPGRFTRRIKVVSRKGKMADVSIKLWLALTGADTLQYFKNIALAIYK